MLQMVMKKSESGKVPEVVFNDDGRGIRINRSDGSIEDGFKVGRHMVVVSFREA